MQSAQAGDELRKKEGTATTWVIGYEDIKDIVRRAFDSESYNLLFAGRPASSKTLFLQGILEMKSSVYFERHQPQHPRLAAHALARMNSDYQQHMQRAARPI